MLHSCWWRAKRKEIKKWGKVAKQMFCLDQRILCERFFFCLFVLFFVLSLSAGVRFIFSGKIDGCNSDRGCVAQSRQGLAGNVILCAASSFFVHKWATQERPRRVRVSWFLVRL